MVFFLLRITMHISTLLHIYLAKIASKAIKNQAGSKRKEYPLIAVNVFLTKFDRKYVKYHIRVST